MATETNKSLRAFEDYYALGPGRSLTALARMYRTRTKPAPPTRNLTALKQWSTGLAWQARVAERDAEIAAAAQRTLEAEAAEVLKAGFAQKFRRVRALNETAELLQRELLTDERRWLPDVKQIGSGEDAERVDIKRFNSAIIEQFRGTLNDIALEMGERARGLQLTGKDGGPVEVRDMEAVRRQRWEQVAPMLAEAAEADDSGGE